MSNETDFVDYFYNKYPGRISFSAGYCADLNEIYPFVFEADNGEAIGVIAIGVIENDETAVHIYHIGAFVSGSGDGNMMLEEICNQADKFDIILSVSPIAMPNGDTGLMTSDALTDWYEKFGFTKDSVFKRKPNPA